MSSNSFPNPFGTTTIPLPAKTLLDLARRTAHRLANLRDAKIDKAVQNCRDEMCTHYIPFTNIAYRRHKLYPDTATALKYAPEILIIRRHFEACISVCEDLVAASLWLVEESGLPPEEQRVNVSLAEFKLLHS